MEVPLKLDRIGGVNANPEEAFMNASLNRVGNESADLFVGEEDMLVGSLVVSHVLL